MSLSPEHNKQGFTLIETLVYLGLISLLLPVITLTVIQLSVAASWSKQKLISEYEQNFILDKLEHLVQNYRIVMPALGAESSTLIITDDNESLMTIEKSGHALIMKTSNGQPLFLTEQAVENFLIERQAYSIDHELINITLKYNGQNFSLSQIIPR
jgi:hypothetical protein